MVLVMKLFFLAVRQLSKPMAKFAQERARTSHALRAIAVGMGRGTHRITARINRLSEGKAPLARLTPMNEEAALEKGAETLSELIIYSTAGVTVAYEYNHQQRDKRRKELAEREAEIARLEAAQRNEERQWAEFKELRTRITLMEEQLCAVRGLAPLPPVSTGTRTRTLTRTPTLTLTLSPQP